ncbi:MAG TPA: ATP-binding protein [Polyangiaceae bacterium]|nr:ATP-binding protein [Polyangiaceae bacterium]
MTFRRLSLLAPHDYRLWVRAGIAGIGLGYLFAFISIQLEEPWAKQGHPRELYVVAAALLAAWLERSGRLRAAAGLVLVAVWVELHISLLVSGVRAAVGGVFPALVTGVTCFFGMRAGHVAAFSSLASVTGAVLLGPLLGVGPGLGPGDLIYLVAIETTTIGIAALLGALMKTLDRVLQTAERDARRVRELIDGAPDAILAVNEQGVIEDCNPSAEQLFERQRLDLLGTAFADLGLRSVAERPCSERPCSERPCSERPCSERPCSERPCRDSLELSALQGEARELFAYPPSRDPQQPIPLEGISRAVARADGSRDCLVVLRDLSARKQAQERTQSLQRQLQHAQKLEALGRLAGGVAHDFNNLLMAVGGYGEALSRHADERVREIAESLVGLRQRAAGLTGHLLAFARKGMTQPRSMDLARAVNEMPRLLRTLIGSRVALEIDAPEPAYIHADPAQIEQVLLNLSLNARDAMPNGGLLRISCGRKGDRVQLCVVDTGHGMDEATRLSAFEPFFTTKPRSQGTGLGLALVHGIMEASGGTIELQSAPGRGTSFTLSWHALSLLGGRGVAAAGVEPNVPLELQRQGEN